MGSSASAGVFTDDVGENTIQENQDEYAVLELQEWESFDVQIGPETKLWGSDIPLTIGLSERAS